MNTLFDNITTVLNGFWGAHGQHIACAVGRAAIVALVQETAEALDIPLRGSADTPQAAPPKNEEDALLEMLNEKPQHINDLYGRSHIPVGKLSALLLMLEMKGKCRQYAGQHFARAS